MEKNKKKNYYKNNNKKYYSKNKKKNNEVKEKITYDSLVNVRESVDEVEYQPLPIGNREFIIKFVAISIVLLAIIFGSLLLFHLI